MRGLVVAFDRPHQGSRRALSLQVAVIVRKIFYGKRHVGVSEKRVILIAVEIEGRGDDYAWADRLAYPACQFGLGARHAPYRHRPMQAEIDALERRAGVDLGNHPADEGFIGVLGDPSGADRGFRPQWRLDANEFPTI